jgi:hypothetical protein
VTVFGTLFRRAVASILLSGDAWDASAAEAGHIFVIFPAIGERP